MSDLKHRKTILDHGYIGLVEAWGSDEELRAEVEMLTKERDALKGAPKLSAAGVELPVTLTEEEIENV